MESVHEMFQFLLDSFRQYSGGNQVWILFPVSLILIWFLGKKEDRKLFLGVLAAEILTVFNPFLIKFLIDKLGFSNRYLRLFWMLVFYVTIAYAAVLFIFRFKKKVPRGIALVVCAALIIFTGNPVFYGEAAAEYSRTRNSYFMDQEIIDICNLVHSEGIESPVILSGGLSLLCRQYDPSVRTYMTRNCLKNAEEGNREMFLQSGVPAGLRTIVQVFFWEDDTVEAAVFENAVRARNINYIISTSEKTDGYLEKTSFYVAAQTANTRIWRAV